MAASDGQHDSGTPLDQFTKSMPPGWRPNVVRYPLRRYIQLLRLWWRQTDLPETSAGPAMAGRLRGTAFQLAMNLSADRLDINTGNRRRMTGDELLSQQAHDPWSHPTTQVLHPEEPAGATILMNALQTEYGVQDQDMSIAALDAFFGHQRGSFAMNDFLSMWKMTFEEANVMADLQMNDVAKSYLLLRSCGLSERAKDDVKMHIGFDLRRFDEMFLMLQRMTTRDQAAAASSLPAMSKQFWAEDSWSRASGSGDAWSDEASYN